MGNILPQTEDAELVQPEPNQETDDLELNKSDGTGEILGEMETEIAADVAALAKVEQHNDDVTVVAAVAAESAKELAEVQGIRVEDMMNEKIHPETSQLMAENSQLMDDLQAAETLAQATEALVNAESASN